MEKIRNRISGNIQKNYAKSFTSFDWILLGFIAIVILALVLGLS